MRGRGWDAVLCGRDRARLQALARERPGSQVRVVSLDEVATLDSAFAGTAAVIHCAGPFLDTARPVIEAALRARIAYLDVAAEQRAVFDAFAGHDHAAREAGVPVLPGMAFYGGLADLLASAVLGDAREADAIEVGVALDSWHPTAGTRLTGQRNHYRRKVVSGGRLVDLEDPAPQREWTFAAPFGTQAMVALPFSEIATIGHHVRVGELHSYMNLRPLQDLRDPRTPPPVAADGTGRSPQRFAMEVRVRRHGATRCLTASGRDIYAITAPLVVEAMARLLDGRSLATGVTSAGAAFDARDFLAALAPEPLRIEG